MSPQRALSTLPLLALGALVQADYYVPYAAEQHAMWASHKENFSPELESATTAEDATHFGNFLDNLKRADARNALEDEPVHGTTKLAHLSQLEFENMLLLDARPDPSPLLAQAVDGSVYNPSADGALKQDWSGKLTTPVRDQGACAAGWAFASAAQVESDAQRVLGVRHNLSPQQLLACDELSDYCQGGWPEAAYAYMRRSGGIEAEASYPYASGPRGAQPACRAVVDDFVLGLEAGPARTIARDTRVVGEHAMALHVNNTGPLTICVDATNWNTYVGGVLTVRSGARINHCAQVVGLSVNQQGEGWWRVRNSWGSDWGEGGHIRLKFGADTCGLAARPTFTVPDYASVLLRQARD